MELIDGMENDNYGLLIHPSIKLHRQYFRELVKLQGIYVIYRYPLDGKHYTTYGEIESNYSKPIKVGCLFVEHPTQQTMRKLGWVTELQEDSSLIHVDYDLPNIQKGSLFIVPSGIDNSKGRLFKVITMQVSMVYPSSLICEIAPVYEDTMVKETVDDYSHSSFNLLNDEKSDMFI